MKPVILDLFSCEGGAAVGYSRAGFEVVGNDIQKQRRYPFPHVAGDALKLLETLLMGREVTFKSDGGLRMIAMMDISVIHASPPCQAYSITKNSHSVAYPELIDPVRALLVESGKPYVIENVVGAPLINPILLTWDMFYTPGSILDEDGTPLRMIRTRLFESNEPIAQPDRPAFDPKIQVAGSYGGARRDKVEAREVRRGGYVPSAKIQSELLDIDWMTQKGMYQSIPPAYSQYVGEQILNSLGAGGR